MEIFYEFKGVFGQQIKMFYCDGAKMLDILTQSGQNNGKMVELFISTCCTIDNKPATKKALEKIAASDLMDLIDAMGRQVTKMKLI